MIKLFVIESIIMFCYLMFTILVDIDITTKKQRILIGIMFAILSLTAIVAIVEF